MARQVLTIPDVPPTLLQKTTADSLYATVGHNHNAAYVAKGGDTMTGALTLTPGDGLVALTANVRSGANAGSLVIQEGVTGLGNPRLLSTKTIEVDAASVLPSRDNAIDFGHPAFRWGNAHARYLSLTPTSGGTALVAMGNVGVGVTPAAWHTTLNAIQIGGVGTLSGWKAASTTELGDNTYYDGTVRRALIAEAGVFLRLANGTASIATAPSVGAGATQTFTPRLTIDQGGNLGVGITPAPTHPARRSLQVGDAGNLMSGAGYNALEIRCNSYQNSSNVPIALAASAAGSLALVNDTLSYAHAPYAAAGAQQTFTTRMTINPAEMIVYASGGGNLWLHSGNSTNFRIATGTGNLELSGAAGYIHPSTDNTMRLGAVSHRWIEVCAVAGAINTSSVKYKDPHGDVDLGAALRAVLRTPARRFAYKGSERVQSGYYLEEADPLFTIGPDEASPGNDFGVLLGAFQALCARLGITA